MEKLQFETGKKTTEGDGRQVRSAADDKNIIVEVDQVIAEALEAGASEIHFEPHQENLFVRCRIKGAMRLVKEVPDRMKSNVVNRIKVLSGMDITKSRIPQSGFFKISSGERKTELYSFLMPTLYGETMVIKIQYKQSATLRLDQLGMTTQLLGAYRKALGKGSGLYLVTGPPGSGKRSTIYASILEVLQENKLAMGFDPVIKYEIPGMVQGKPEERSEFTFAEAIRNLMSHEPDIAYVGDVTCQEDARAAIQGAFAKRIVLCRMTANDTVNALQNILDMGVQPFLMAASLTAILNQRLLRRLCPRCRQGYDVDEALMKELGFRLPEGTRFYRPLGCQACEATGYSGVVSIFELYVPSEELNKLVVAKEPVQTIRQRAVREGMATLKVDGIQKAMLGLATLEDVLNSL